MCIRDSDSAATSCVSTWRAWRRTCSMAGPRACVSGAVERDERPVVGSRFQREPKHAVLTETYLAVRFHVDERIRRRASGADHELADSRGGVRVAVAILRREAFIDVIVGCEDDVGAGIVENAPEIPHLFVVAVLRGREEREVPVGDRAPRGIRAEVAPQPVSYTHLR